MFEATIQGRHGTTTLTIQMTGNRENVNDKGAEYIERMLADLIVVAEKKLGYSLEQSGPVKWNIL